MDGRNKSGHDDKGPRFSAGLFVCLERSAVLLPYPKVLARRDRPNEWR